MSPLRHNSITCIKIISNRTVSRDGGVKSKQASFPSNTVSVEKCEGILIRCKYDSAEMHHSQDGHSCIVVY